MTFIRQSKQLTNSLIHFISYDVFDPDAYLEILTPQELERYFEFHSMHRKREFVATRYLRHQLFGFEHIHYDTHGAPYIRGEGFISISHTQGVVGIAFNKKFRIGLDIETRGEKAMRVHRKFLSSEELKLFDVTNADTMTSAWCAKETLYKIAGRKQIDFRSELSLKPEKDGILFGNIQTKSLHLSAQIHTFVNERYVFSINESALCPNN